MIPLTWLIGGVAAAALVFSASGYLAGYSARGAKCAEQVRAIYDAAEAQRQKFQDELNDASIEYESLRATQNTQRSVNTNTVREIYRDVEVAATCEPPTAAVGVLNTEVLRANAAASGKSGG